MKFKNLCVIWSEKMENRQVMSVVQIVWASVSNPFFLACYIFRAMKKIGLLCSSFFSALPPLRGFFTARIMISKLFTFDFILFTLAIRVLQSGTRIFSRKQLCPHF